MNSLKFSIPANTREVLLLTRFAIKQLWRIALNGGKKKAILRLEMRNSLH